MHSGTINGTRNAGSTLIREDTMGPKRGAKRGRLSAQGDISFHATFDRAAARMVDPTEATGMIHVGEIVCAVTDSVGSCCMRKVRARPGGPTISVCAVVPLRANDVEEDKFPLHGGFPEGIKYVGVAKTKLDASKSPAEQRFVVQCGGLATVRLPEGSAHHYVGDLLLCGNSVKPKPGEKDGNRVTLFPDYEEATGKPRASARRLKLADCWPLPRERGPRRHDGYYT